MPSARAKTSPTARWTFRINRTCSHLKAMYSATVTAELRPIIQTAHLIPGAWPATCRSRTPS